MKLKPVLIACSFLLAQAVFAETPAEVPHSTEPPVGQRVAILEQRSLHSR
jgi:hypothetical protein